MEGVVGGTRQNIVTLQTINNQESVATKNETKAMLYDELRKQLLMEMVELLEEVKTQFKRWHFEEIGKYTNAFNAA